MTVNACTYGARGRTLGHDHRPAHLESRPVTSLASPLTDARPAERLAELAARLRPCSGRRP